MLHYPSTTECCTTHQQQQTRCDTHTHTHPHSQSHTHHSILAEIHSAVLRARAFGVNRKVGHNLCIFIAAQPVLFEHLFDVTLLCKCRVFWFNVCSCQVAGQGFIYIHEHNLCIFIAAQPVLFEHLFDVTLLCTAQSISFFP